MSAGSTLIHLRFEGIADAAPSSGPLAVGGPAIPVTLHDSRSEDFLARGRSGAYIVPAMTGDNTRLAVFGSAGAPALAILPSPRRHGRRCTAVVAAALLGALAPALAACGSRAWPSHVRRTEQRVSPAERKIIGVGSPYPADTTLRPTLDALNASQRARRELAWRAVARALAPVPLAESTVAPLNDEERPSVPRWQTWYSKEDFKRIFTRLFDGLDAAARKARRPFSAAAVDEALRLDVSSVDELPEWTNDRYDARVAKLETQQHFHGLTGLSRVAYSPSALQHMLRNYGRMLDCAADLSAHEPAELPPNNDNFAPCFGSEFPIDSVVIKSAWQRAAPGFAIPVHDTSPAALAKTLASGDWGKGVGSAEPGPDAIHTMTLENGSSYRLAALHIVTKELREWLWITLWWSPDPDSDFGADRPAFIGELGGAWRNYKMAVATGYDELDPDPKGGFASISPKLADAVAVVSRGSAGHSWASNPYLETGAANAKTNCIGCHQHAGTPLENPDILGDPVGFPAEGRTRVRENFPFDYIWSIHAVPENLTGFLSTATASE